MNSVVPKCSRGQLQYEYKAILKGIMPLEFDYDRFTTPWVTDGLKECKKPSESPHPGVVEKSSFTTLTKTAIVERKHQMKEFLIKSRQVFSRQEEDGDSKSHSDESKNVATEGAADSIYLGETVETEKRPDGSKKSFENENGFERTVDELQITQLTQLATKFTIKNFDPKTAVKPDIVCERLFPILLATESDSFVIRARKIKFIPKGFDQAVEIVEVSLNISDDDNSLKFTKWPPASNEKIQESPIEKEVVLESIKEKPRQVEEDSDDFSNQQAFIHGVLSRSQYSSDGKECKDKKEFNLMMGAFVRGVWNLEEDPKNYTCAHLVEIRSAWEETVIQPFYKQVRMRRNYWQSHLTGSKHYLVRINGPTSHSLLADTWSIKELRLYDVEQIPHAIQVAAEEDNFEPWTVDALHGHLFDCLEMIYEQTKEIEPWKYLYFIKYNLTDLPVFDSDGSLLENFIRHKRTILISCLPQPSPESADEANENKRNDLGINLMKSILKVTGYFQNVPLPIPKWVQENSRTFYDLSLTFAHENQAKAYFARFLNCWKRKVDIPVGLERAFIKLKKIELQEFIPIAKMSEQNRHVGRSRGNRGGTKNQVGMNSRRTAGTDGHTCNSDNNWR